MATHRFDLQQIPVPFRMQPGLRRLAPGTPQLTPLAPGSALWREKRAVVDAGASRLSVPGFDEAPVLAAIAQRARLEGHAPAGPVELAFEEDFALLDGATGTLPWLCVCVPSHWSPADKLGLPLAAVHAPVADREALVASSAHLVALVTGGDGWERSVWTITPSGRYDQHPGRHARTPWPGGADPEAFAAACFLRSERQTFFPGPGAKQAIFTIRVALQPLPDAVASPADASRLHDSLATMSEAVLAYKGLAAARAPLLAWLARKAARWS